MIKTPTTLPSGTSPRLSPAHGLSLRRKISFVRGNPCKAAIHTATETASVGGVETTRKTGGSLYEVLKVSRNASPMEIKAAYWSLAKMYHPDSSHSDGRDFMEIHDAYATLSDPTARALYDLSFSDGSIRRQFGYGGGNTCGFNTTRKWETDQCW